MTAVGSHYTISNVGNGMVLDAEDCEVANGTVVRQWAQLDNLCQQWDIAPRVADRRRHPLIRLSPMPSARHAGGIRLAGRGGTRVRSITDFDP